MSSRPFSLMQVELLSAIVPDPLVVTPDTPVADAIARMSGVRSRCSVSPGDRKLNEVYTDVRSSCVVVMDHQRIVGILTERDVVRLITQRRVLEHIPIAEVMTSPVLTLREAEFTDLLLAVNLLQQHHIRHLPVLDERDRLVGLLTHESLRQVARPIDLMRLRLVSEVMVTEVVCAHSDGTLLEIAQLMEQFRISSVVIVQEQPWESGSLSMPIGLITERDIVQFQTLNLDPTICKARSVMSTPLFSVQPEDSLWQVQQLMEQQHIQRLVVTGPLGELVGIVTQTNLLQALNPLELYKLAEVLESKVAQLEAEKLALLESRTAELEQQVAERTTALLASEAQFQKLAATVPGILYTSIQKPDGSLTFTYVNAVASEVLELDSAEILADANQVMALFHPEDVPGYHQAVAQSLATLQPFHYEWRIITPSGRLKWLQADSRPELLPNQDVLWFGVALEITDRKQAELDLAHLNADLEERVNQRTTALHQSEAKYRQIFEIANEGIWAVDGEANTLFCNTALTLMLGTTVEEMAGTSLFNFLDQEMHPAVYERLERRKQGIQEQYELPLRCRDGSVILALVAASPLLDEAGQFIGSLGMLTDITERKQAEAALQKSELLFRRVFDSNVVGMMFTNPDGAILDANDRFLAMVGYTRDELQQHQINWIDLTPPEYRQQDQDAAIQLQQRGLITPWEKAYYHKDGHRVPVLIGIAVLSPEDATNVCVVVNISDRKQAEQIIQQQAQQETLLREITQRIRQSLDLQVLFDTACQEIRQVLQADRVGMFRFCPGSGYTDGEFVAESVVNGFSSVLALHVHDHCFGEKYAPLYIQGRHAAMENIYELDECHMHVLTQFQVQANLVIPLICGQDLWGLLCIHQCGSTRRWQQTEIDLGQQLANQLAIAIQQANLFEQLQQELTERQQTQQLLTERNQQLALSNQQLARATRLKDEFLANMSHELRTPLNAILGMTEGLQEEVFGPINEQQAKSLHTVETSAFHLLSLINDILDVAKIESGQIELDCTSVAVAPLCSSSLAFIKQQALKKRIQLSTRIPANLPHLLVDERRIRQVMINLLTNAVKFTPEGGRITLIVALPECETPIDQRLVRVAIQDTGIGIAPDNLHKLFQPFIQIDSALNRQYTGTGLGLALVKQLVELHGGQVDVTSEVGVGSCFTIDLPCDPATLTNFQRPEQPNREATESTHTPWDLPHLQVLPLVLLAEDNEANISTIANYLGAKGYRLIVAKNGQDAIELTRTERPDLILMDIQMPGMDGLQAMQQIRQDPSLVQVPIIALTALAMADDRDRCLAAGANEYLSKPVRLKELAGTIQQLLAIADRNHRNQ